MVQIRSISRVQWFNDRSGNQTLTLGYNVPNCPTTLSINIIVEEISKLYNIFLKTLTSELKFVIEKSVIYIEDLQIWSIGL